MAGGKKPKVTERAYTVPQRINPPRTNKAKPSNRFDEEVFAQRSQTGSRKRKYSPNDGDVEVHMPPKPDKGEKFVNQNRRFRSYVLYISSIILEVMYISYVFQFLDVFGNNTKLPRDTEDNNGKSAETFLPKVTSTQNPGIVASDSEEDDVSPAQELDKVSVSSQSDMFEENALDESSTAFIPGTPPPPKNALPSSRRTGIFLIKYIRFVFLHIVFLFRIIQGPSKIG